MVLGWVGEAWGKGWGRWARLAGKGGEGGMAAYVHAHVPPGREGTMGSGRRGEGAKVTRMRGKAQVQRQLARLLRSALGLRETPTVQYCLLPRQSTHTMSPRPFARPCCPSTAFAQ